MEQSTQTEMSLTELSKDIYAKLDTIHSVLGYILEKTNLSTIQDLEDNLDARDASGSVLP
jgi:hypothetical protein